MRAFSVWTLIAFIRRVCVVLLSAPLLLRFLLLLFLLRFASLADPPTRIAPLLESFPARLLSELCTLSSSRADRHLLPTNLRTRVCAVRDPDTRSCLSMRISLYLPVHADRQTPPIDRRRATSR